MVPCKMLHADMRPQSAFVPAVVCVGIGCCLLICMLFSAIGCAAIEETAWHVLFMFSSCTFQLDDGVVTDVRCACKCNCAR